MLNYNPRKGFWPFLEDRQEGLSFVFSHVFGKIPGVKPRQGFVFLERGCNFRLGNVYQG